MTDPGLACPRCSLPLGQTLARDVEAALCGRCTGIWLDRETFRRLCEEPGRYARVFGPPLLTPPAGDLSRHLCCPHCAEIMTRKSFPKSSSIVIDLCHEHGVWFDHDELQRILSQLGGATPSGSTKGAAPPPIPPAAPKAGDAKAAAAGRPQKPAATKASERPTPPKAPPRPPEPRPTASYSPPSSSSSASSVVLDTAVAEIAIEGVIALIGALLD